MGRRIISKSTQTSVEKNKKSTTKTSKNTTYTVLHINVVFVVFPQIILKIKSFLKHSVTYMWVGITIYPYAKLVLTGYMKHIQISLK